MICGLKLDKIIYKVNIVENIKDLLLKSPNMYCSGSKEGPPRETEKGETVK